MCARLNYKSTSHPLHRKIHTAIKKQMMQHVHNNTSTKEGRHLHQHILSFASFTNYRYYMLTRWTNKEHKNVQQANLYNLFLKISDSTFF
jgi:hypothetical protein